MTETMQRVECGACGWTGRRKTGNVVMCPRCGKPAAFQPEQQQMTGNW